MNIIGAWPVSEISRVMHRAVYLTKKGTAHAGEEVKAHAIPHGSLLSLPDKKPELVTHGYESLEQREQAFETWLERQLNWELAPAEHYHPLYFASPVDFAHVFTHLKPEQIAKLGKWEQSFVADIPAAFDKYGNFTQKQMDVIRRIVNKLAALSVGLPVTGGLKQWR